MVFGILNVFSWIFDAVSSEKTFPSSLLFLFTYIQFRTVRFFLPAKFWLAIQIFGGATVCKGVICLLSIHLDLRENCCSPARDQWQIWSIGKIILSRSVGSLLSRDKSFLLEGMTKCDLLIKRLFYTGVEQQLHLLHTCISVDNNLVNLSVDDWQNLWK